MDPFFPFVHRLKMVLTIVMTVALFARYLFELCCKVWRSPKGGEKTLITTPSFDGFYLPPP
jgi:hypothetical protein